MNYVETIFPNELVLFLPEEIKLNTVIVEGGYMSGIPVKTCKNQNSLVVKVFNPFGQYLVEEPFTAMTYQCFWVDLSLVF